MTKTKRCLLKAGLGPVWLFIMLILIAPTAGAQVFGGNPVSKTWEQVNGKAARVIFPFGLDSVAKRVSGIAETLNKNTQESIGTKQHKIDIVLQNETTVSNGYVALGPYRSEFYLTPPQNSFSLGSLPWYEQLTIHEFRHVQQNNNFNIGFSHLMRVIFGEEGQALANNAVVPDWFYEGDAVYNETNVSRQGRGRLANFYNGYRSLWAAGKEYSWMKLRNGSYRDFTPDHYALGYLQVAYGREKYGEDFWKKVTTDAVKYKGLFYPFQSAIKRYSEKSFKVFREDALNYFKDQYKNTKPLVDDHSQRYADEEYPSVTDEGAVIFVKSSFRKVQAFTLREAGKPDRRIKIRGLSLDHHFSYRNGFIVYSGYRPDLRRGWRNFGEIRMIEVKTGKEKALTNKTKYFSPDLSPDGKSIVTVELSKDGNSSLDLLNASTGSIIKKLENPGTYVYAYPKFTDNSRQVVSVIKNPAGKMSLALTDITSGKTETLLPFSFHVMGFPVVTGDTVFFSASSGEFDRIYAYLLHERLLFRVGRSGDEHLTGDYQPAVGGGKLYWSRFTADGSRLVSSALKDLVWFPVEPLTLEAPLPDFKVSLVNNNPLTGDLPVSTAPVSSYSKIKGLINFHSLEPIVDDPLYSLSIVGENVLNTMQSELALAYNRNEGYKRVGFNAIYGGLFPYLSGGVTYTLDRRGLYRNRRINWNEWEYRAGLNVPLNLSRGNHITNLNIGTDYIYNQPKFRGVYKDSLGDRSFGYTNSYFTISNQVQKAKQQIYPHFAQSAYLGYRRALHGGEANQFLASGYLYFPGFSNNHSLVLNAAFQQHDTLNQRSFTNSFPFSRGYTAENIRQMTKFGATYHLPLFYPDRGFGNIVYFLRVRGAAFYDHTKVMDARKNTASFRSTGGEVYFDTSWWNELPLSFGFRLSYLLDPDLYGGSGSTRFEFILPLNILNR
ncbi:MAG: hypothetical protein ABI151_17695 [Chitinophagaceae bacterium]